jgi:hypothetical protein
LQAAGAELQRASKAFSELLAKTGASTVEGAEVKDQLALIEAVRVDASSETAPVGEDRL